MSENNFLFQLKNLIIKTIKKIFKKKIKEITLTFPPDPKFGDFSFSCFKLAKELKKNPQEIADLIKKEIKKNGIIEKVESIKGYLNFFVSKEKLAEMTLKQIFEEKENYGKLNLGKNKKIMVEFSSPNTNKPQHIGHLRNNLLGFSLANILEEIGFKVIRTCLFNDRGIAISKSILAYLKWGENKEPKKEKMKGDFFVGFFYNLFEKKLDEERKEYLKKKKTRLEKLDKEEKRKIEEEFLKNSKLYQEALEILRKWEEGDKEIRKIWEKMNQWSYQGLKETYKNLGIKFDKIYYESKTYKLGKKIVLEALKKGICQKRKDEAVVIGLSKFSYEEKVLLRSDGTSVYITEDIGLAKKKFEDFKLEKNIYIVASEHDYHFKVLFKILELFGFEWVKNCYHLSYGMVFLPSGILKSRKGEVVEIDELIEKIKELAKEKIIERHKNLRKKEIEKRSKTIALAAIKFFFLKFNPSSNIYFNPQKALSFEGDSGPYLQYMYARILSILRKGKVKKISLKIDFSKVNTQQEIDLIKLLGNYPEIIKRSALNYNPSILIDYLLNLTQTFTQFYHSCLVLKTEKEIRKARLFLISMAKEVLKNGLNLLGIEILEKM